MSEGNQHELSRRKFFEAAIGAAAAVGLETACGGTDPSSELSAGGGTGGLNVGQGGASATFDPNTLATTISNGGSSRGGPSPSQAFGGASATGQQVSSGGATLKGSSTPQGSALSSGGTTASGGTPSVGGSSVTGGTQASGGTSSNASTSVGNSLVGLVRDASVLNATKQAINMIGGFPDVKGKRVLLKPNVNTGDPSPFSTNPEIARTVIELCKANGASRIVIADRSYTPISTTTALAKSGLTEVAKELDVETVDLDGSATTAVKPAGATSWPSSFRIYNLALTGCDVVMNLCCCKNHNSSANFTASLKNWVGLVHTGDRNTVHGNIGQRVPELHLAVRESLIVMDATKVVLTLGPNPASGQATASPGIVVATRDNVACDVTCLAILKHYLAKAGISNNRIDAQSCWKQPQIARAVAMGLWISKASQYNFSESNITEMADLLKYINA